MSEVAGNLPCKFISFRHLGVEPSAHKLPEERESENPQNVFERKEAKTIGIGENFTFPAKSSSSLEGAPVRAQCIGTESGYEDLHLTIADKNCVLTNSDDDKEDLSAFVAERLQPLS